MDFGDILDAWDRQTAKPQGRKRGSTAEKKQPPDAGDVQKQDEGDFQRRTDPLTRWLRINGVYDKDAAESEVELPAGERRRRLLQKRPDAVIDLHGFTQDEAWNELEAFFRNAREQCFEKVLVVHGKGNHSPGEAVLKQTVKRFIERCSYAGESGHGNAASGGTGATWVILKNSDGKAMALTRW
ncbi:MAG: Smr/MutS family protein [Treponema sp.]|jgi:DNA-nicking Smr family endonuclease|nr:Smr/MutS family protein [Treponema sp.]